MRFPSRTNSRYPGGAHASLSVSSTRRFDSDESSDPTAIAGGSLTAAYDRTHKTVLLSGAAATNAIFLPSGETTGTWRPNDPSGAATSKRIGAAGGASGSRTDMRTTSATAPAATPTDHANRDRIRCL